MALMSYLSTDSFAVSWSERMLRFWAASLHFSISAHDLQIANLVLRKFAHLFEFFVLGRLLYRALEVNAPIPYTAMGQALLLGLAFAMLDELHQAFTRTRGASFVDVGWDLAGVLSSQLLVFCVRIPRNMKERTESNL